MKPFPRECLRLVERILREYPDRVEELKILNDFISSRCHSTAQEPPTTKNTPSGSPQERIVEAKESYAYYRWLSGFVELVHSVMEMLTEEERKLIDCIYREEMDLKETSMEMEVSSSTVSRMKKRILLKSIPEILPAYMLLWDEK